MSLDAMKQALEALEHEAQKGNDDAYRVERDALRAAIEKAQEPMSIIQQLWDIIDDIDTYTDMAKADDKLYRLLVERRQKDRWKTGITTDGQTLNVPFYAAPRQWQGLTDEERGITAAETWGSVLIAPQSYPAFARAIEVKLKEKNT